MGRCVGGAWVLGMLPGLVRLGLGVGGGLDGEEGEVVGMVSCEMGMFPQGTVLLIEYKGW